MQVFIRQNPCLGSFFKNRWPKSIQIKHPVLSKLELVEIGVLMKSDIEPRAIYQRGQIDYAYRVCNGRNGNC